MEIPEEWGHSAVSAEVTINGVTRIDINCSKCLFAGGLVMRDVNHARAIANAMVIEHMNQTTQDDTDV